MPLVMHVSQTVRQIIQTDPVSQTDSQSDSIPQVGLQDAAAQGEQLVALAGRWCSLLSLGTRVHHLRAHLHSWQRAGRQHMFGALGGAFRWQAGRHLIIYVSAVGMASYLAHLAEPQDQPQGCTMMHNQRSSRSILKGHDNRMLPGDAFFVFLMLPKVN